MIVVRWQFTINWCLILIITLLRKLRNCKGYWIQFLYQCLRTLGFVTRKVNKGNWRIFTHWQPMWLKLNLQKPEQKHGSQLSNVHEVIRFWYEVYWYYFKCLLCTKCEIWNSSAMNKDSDSSKHSKYSLTSVESGKYPVSIFVCCKYNSNCRNYTFGDLAQ